MGLPKCCSDHDARALLRWSTFACLMDWWNIKIFGHLCRTKVLAWLDWTFMRAGFWFVTYSWRFLVWNLWSCCYIDNDLCAIYSKIFFTQTRTSLGSYGDSTHKRLICSPVIYVPNGLNIFNFIIKSVYPYLFSWEEIHS